MREKTDYEKLIDMLVDADINYEIRNPFDDRWSVVIHPNTKHQTDFTFHADTLKLWYVN